MARKTTGNTTTNRRKRSEVPSVPAVVQVAPEVHNQVHEENHHEKTPNNAGKNGSASKQVRVSSDSVSPAAVSLSPVNVSAVNLEDEIRHRAYELYLERRATGIYSGDENQDWLVAEREIRSRYGRLVHHTTA
jgi:hypothetical protein